MSGISSFYKWAYSTIGFSIGVIAIGFPYACSLRSKLEETTRREPVKATAPAKISYSFGNIGSSSVTSPDYSRRSTMIKEIQLGDMDGDGDLDIVVLDTSQNVRIYENKIPQKNLLESLKGKEILER